VCRGGSVRRLTTGSGFFLAWIIFLPKELSAAQLTTQMAAWSARQLSYYIANLLNFDTLNINVVISFEKAQDFSQDFLHPAALARQVITDDANNKRQCCEDTMTTELPTMLIFIMKVRAAAKFKTKTKNSFFISPPCKTPPKNSGKGTYGRLLSNNNCSPSLR